MVRVPTNRIPTHPGEMLLEEFLSPMGVSQRELSNAIHVSYQRINEIVNGRRGITPSTALRLAKFFGTSAGFWMNLQLRWDLYHTQASEGQMLETIKPYHPTAEGKVAA
ncbi:MAG: HigA family addiction module antitoxin [Chloroflexota bacterium]